MYSIMIEGICESRKSSANIITFPKYNKTNHYKFSEASICIFV